MAIGQSSEPHDEDDGADRDAKEHSRSRSAAAAPLAQLAVATT
jgi:hypothetical protein